MSQQPRKMIHLPKVRMLSRGGRPSSGIRITQVKSIKPPDPEMVKKTEEEILRAQLQQEIVSRSRMCAYKGYECTLPVLTGRQYCYEHILKDPTAPYRQCTHTSNNGDRCQLPAPLEQRDHRDQSLCYEHARLALQARLRSAAPPPPVATAETLLHQLQHYVRPERTRTTSCASAVSVVSDPADSEPLASTPVDPFKQIDATAVNASYSTTIMEYASCTDSDCDSVTLGPDGDCRGGHDEDLSDAEDAPCEDQPLWRAGVYTAEEAVSETKNALKTLQAAYIRQMGRLRVLLQTARLQYIRSLKAEKEQYCSINAQARSGPLSIRERRQLRKLKAYAGYHRKHGVEALLAKKLHQKRAKTDCMETRGATGGRGCVFAEGGVRCSGRALPAAKHCSQHVLRDNKQVLFVRCGVGIAGVGACNEPVAKLPLPAATCRYHATPPAYTVFALKKDESDSDSESQSSTDGSHTEEMDRSIEDQVPIPESITQEDYE
ncbi:KAT8 regulatory NSL complex subunit 2 [Achroia grisella]|uniref:KAT8 regulatory NSL complex subunit 2 n=1 Tax=Achroia grisella TaxID=688607 RepID=UPI0027D2B7E4|nr:KAT8 regulatory NSL complex subunit 2 [Achroia grisella]